MRAYMLSVPVLLGLCWVAAPSVDSTPSAFSTFGYKVTGGAAPGYVEDAACTICHREIAESYSEVGMARSFAAPEKAVLVEKFSDQPYYHEPSDRFYRMRRSDEGALTFERWQLDERGHRVNELELDVDWVLGSGHTSRVYLYRTPSGELFQLPLAWYSQDGGAWRMSPGYDNPNHSGVARRVQRECMFCHNAYPDVPEGSDVYGKAHLFPESLPQGTGCQRCHGPGAEHLSMAFAGEMDEDKLRGAIVNPGRLEPERRNDVCYGCHMQPTVALMGVRRFDRPDYSFRPGEALSDYLVLMDVKAEGEDPGDRFEINHHPYRLEQSACFQQSEGQLSCLSCHDPHRKVPRQERAAHYRNACMGCHDGNTLSTEAHGSPPIEGAATKLEDGQSRAELDCVACHMPRRRTRDVVHVVMTDHKIQKGPIPEGLTAPRQESDPILVDMSFYRPDEAPEGAVAEAYRAIAVLRAGGGEDAYRHLERQMAALDLKDRSPRFALLRAQLTNQQWKKVGLTASSLYAETNDPLVLEWWALALLQSGEREKAALLLRSAIEKAPDRPELLFNLGVILLGGEDPDPAAAQAVLEKSTHLRPNLAIAWAYLGDALIAQNKKEEAEAAYRRALSADPSNGRAYVSLAQMLREQGRAKEAIRWLRHGSRHAQDPDPARELLAQWQANGP